jgi:hypothetical protein
MFNLDPARFKRKRRLIFSHIPSSPETIKLSDSFFWFSGGKMNTLLKSLNLALAFFLELAMLAAFAYWGIFTGQTTLAKIGLGIGVPLLVAVIWGFFMAPTSSRRLQGAAYLALKLVLFGLAVAALIASGRTMLGAVFGAVVVINSILIRVWKQ